MKTTLPVDEDNSTCGRRRLYLLMKTTLPVDEDDPTCWWRWSRRGSCRMAAFAWGRRVPPSSSRPPRARCTRRAQGPSRCHRWRSAHSCWPSAAPWGRSPRPVEEGEVRTDRWTDGRTDGRTDRRTDSSTRTLSTACKEGRRGGEGRGGEDGWTDRRTDGPTDEPVTRPVYVNQIPWKKTTNVFSTLFNFTSKSNNEQRQRRPGRPGRGDQDTRGGNDAPGGREGTIKTRGAATTPWEAGKGRSRHAGRQRRPGRPGRGDQDTRGGNDTPGGREGTIKTRGAATMPREAGKGRSRHAGRQRRPGRPGRGDQDTRGGNDAPGGREGAIKTRGAAYADLHFDRVAAYLHHRVAPAADLEAGVAQHVAPVAGLVEARPARLVGEPRGRRDEPERVQLRPVEVAPRQRRPTHVDLRTGKDGRRHARGDESTTAVRAERIAWSFTKTYIINYNLVIVIGSYYIIYYNIILLYSVVI